MIRHQNFSKTPGNGRKLKGEDKLVYQVLLSTFFINYYEQNMWKINGRTNINSRIFPRLKHGVSLILKTTCKNLSGA
ncbi:hypothetical protein EJ377_00890 [Chryseobacterium arthrosphaerae]|uniref:Uncharacterized protein n=1 Tax=Chryseobacterium arthrosphaerae TaxID=651561 RepID=A0A3S0N500_9FLAO|nr:hypothetical protein EJ377_00890 [Chryseobacterium arthrosphaerae]